MVDLEKLKNLIQRMMDYYSVPGMALGLIEGDRVNFLSFGVRNEKGDPFRPDTISGIGSCTKSMTDYAVMRLAERGILDIDEPVKNYVPFFALWDEEATSAVTLRDMMCHRTGVGFHDGTWPDNSISRVEYLKRLKYMEPTAPFRTLAQYSNVMYTAIGGILEQVTGKKWEEILKEEIFEPLHMDRTCCLMEEALADSNSARPFRWNQGLHEVPPWNIDQAGPCGSVMSTAEDMVKWLSLHIQGGMVEGKYFLKPKGFLDMHTPQILMDYPHVLGGRSLGYGFGWRVMEYRGSVIQQHTGKIEGYSAFQFYIPVLSCGAVYLQNLHCPDNPLIFAIQGFLLDAFLGRGEEDWFAMYTDPGRSHAPEDMYHHLEFHCLPESRAKGPLSHPLSDYEGTYESGGYGTFRVKIRDGKLFLDERAVRDRPMTHLYYDTFRVNEVKEDTDLYEIPLTFFADDAGEIAGFHLLMEPRVKSIRFTKVRKPEEKIIHDPDAPHY